MLTPKGMKVIEYNARFGDPETQVVLPRLKTDLMEIFEACVDGTLDKVDVQWEDNAAALRSYGKVGGYPCKLQKKAMKLLALKMLKLWKILQFFTLVQL